MIPIFNSSFATGAVDARGDSGDMWGSTGGDGGVGDSHFDVSGEERGDDSEMGLGSGACSSVSSLTDICISTSVVSLGNGNSSSNNAEAGGHSAIAVSTAGDGDRGDGVLEVEAGVGGRSVGTSTLDGASEPIEVEEVGGGSMKDDGVDMDISSESPIVGEVQSKIPSSNHPSPSARVQAQRTA